MEYKSPEEVSAEELNAAFENMTPEEQAEWSESERIATASWMVSAIEADRVQEVPAQRVTLTYWCQEPECDDDDYQEQNLAEITSAGTLVCRSCDSDLVLLSARVS